MAERTVQDRLREEYFELLPEVRRVTEELETRVKDGILRLRLDLREPDRILVESRVKECESAVESLRRRLKDGKTFDSTRAAEYSLTQLKDLAGVRVLVFPRGHIESVNSALAQSQYFSSWTADPVFGTPGGAPLALKYYGKCTASSSITAEYQIVPLLTGLFWKVEHAAIYKPAPRLRGVMRLPSIRERADAVVESMREFEDEFERLVRLSQDQGPT